MSHSLPDGTVDLQNLRVQLYDLLGFSYSAVSPSPASMLLLQAAGMIDSPTGFYKGLGRVRGVGFDGRRFSVQEIKSNGGNGGEEAGTGFDGVIVSISHALSIRGRTVVLPDRGLLNPRHIDGMKRVGFPSSCFEEAYEVYSDDQVDGRTLIPPDLVQRLIDFKPILSTGQASIAFSGRQIHVVIPTGDLMRFSEDYPIYHNDEAADRIVEEMIRVFDMVARVDALHSSADRHCPAEREKARIDYYLSSTRSIAPMVRKAMEAGTLKDSRKARHMTRDAYLIDPSIHGLMMPRV